MELFSPEFFTALAAIIFIDLLLAGDNAIIIALAAKNLPPELRSRAIVWGTAGAIVIRTAMTLGVVWLLKIPGIMLVGGLMLIWIAYKLIAPAGAGEGEEGITPAASFWQAIRTIVIADAVMGIDNVLGVAGAAQGSFLLVVIGLIISIPIMIWGSKFVLRLLARYPWVEYAGAGILLLVAAKMLVTEPVVKEALEGRDTLSLLVQGAVVIAVLALAFLRRAFRAQDRIEDLLAERGCEPAAGGAGAARVLVPVDGTRNSLEALSQLVDRAAGTALEVHLVHVRAPLRRLMARVLPGARRAEEQEARAALAPAVQCLEARGVDFRHHVVPGDPADVIARLSTDLGCHRIVMGASRRNSLARLVENPMTSGVLERAAVSVELIESARPSLFARIAIPAGLGAGVALFAMTMD